MGIFDSPVHSERVGEFAIADTEAGINISTQKRLELALSPETAQHPLALTQRQAKQITQNRMRSAMAELSHGKIDRIAVWLEEVAKESPAKAIELWMQLAEFSLPKLKSIEVNVADSSGNVRNYTVAQLEALVGNNDADASVVAEQ